MLCQEGRPPLVTMRVSFVSAVQVGSSDPLEQPLTPDDHSSQRTEEEPIPNTDDNDRDGVHNRPSDCDGSLTHESATKHRHARSCARPSRFGGKATVALASLLRSDERCAPCFDADWR